MDRPISRNSAPVCCPAIAGHSGTWPIVEPLFLAAISMNVLPASAVIISITLAKIAIAPNVSGRLASNG
jgi:hypothetical protein